MGVGGRRQPVDHDPPCGRGDPRRWVHGGMGSREAALGFGEDGAAGGRRMDEGRASAAIGLSVDSRTGRGGGGGRLDRRWPMWLDVAPTWQPRGEEEEEESRHRLRRCVQSERFSGVQGRIASGGRDKKASHRLDSGDGGIGGFAGRGKIRGNRGCESSIQAVGVSMEWESVRPDGRRSTEEG